MSMDWPEPVERVAAFLRDTGAEARLEELPTETGSAEAAADAIGCTPGELVDQLHDMGFDDVRFVELG